MVGSTVAPRWLPAHCSLALMSSEALYAGVVCLLDVNNDLPVITADQSTEWALPPCRYPQVWFPAPQAITVHLAACEGNRTALLLRLFSSVEGWRLGWHTVLKKGLFYSILFHSTPCVCGLVWSYFLCWIKARAKNFSGKWSFSSRKETPKISAFVSLQTVLWVCASAPHSIKTPHSKIKELICREENSAEAQWASLAVTEPLV